MSIWARHWALAQNVGGDGSSRAARRCVLLDLADWMIGDDAIESHPTIETIAFDTGFNRQTVMKALAALVDQGLVTRRYEWDGKKKYSYYRFVGYVPKEWQGSIRPDATNPEGPRFKTSENVDVRNPGGTESRTTEGTKSHTTEGTKSRTYGGTKFRTVTRNIHGITRNSHGVDTNPNPAPIDDVPFPDFEEPTSEEFFNAPLVDEAKSRDEPQPEAKPKAPKTTRGTRLTIKTLPDEWRAWMAKHFPKYDPDLVFAGFHDYWIGVSGAKGVKLDWFATFRNHVRGIPEWKQKNFIKKDCEQETLPNSNEWTQARRLREGYGWATTY